MTDAKSAYEKLRKLIIEEKRIQRKIRQLRAQIEEEGLEDD